MKKCKKYGKKHGKKYKMLKRYKKYRALKKLLRALGKLLAAGLIAFIATFALYMFNGENKLIYYVIRPLLNKHYDSQVRDRKI